MNRNSLARKIASKTHLTLRQAENLIIAFGAVVTDALENDEKVIYSNFGSFYIVEYPSKTLSHPKSKQKMVILPTRVAKFMPSDNLKKLANGDIDLTRLEKIEEELMPEDESVGIPISVIKSNQPKPKETFEPEDADSETAESTSTLTRNQIDPKPEKKINDGSILSPKSNILHQAHAEDDIETYHKHKEVNHNTQPANVYEEILSDGSSEVSTIKGAIKLHRDKIKQTESHKDSATPKAEAPAESVKDQDAPDESKSPLALLKLKLGIGSKLPKADSKTESVSGDQPTQIDKEIDDATKPVVSMAGNGIFDKVAESKISSDRAADHSGQKIEEIKNELKEASDAPVNPESMPQTPTSDQPKDAEAEVKPPNTGPLFTGIEGAFSFDKAKIEYRDLSKLMVPKEILAKIPENIARSYKAVVFEKSEDGFAVAMVDPEDIETREMLKRILGEKVKVYLTTESDIAAILNQYQGLETEVSSAIASAEEEEIDDEKGSQRSKVEEDTISDDAPAAKIVSSLLKRAIRDKASDIHIEPTEKEVEVRFRLDGVLRKKVSLPKEIQAAVISRIKILSNLKIDEQRVPQDGRFNMQVDNRRVDFRVSSMPIAFGEKIVMRILDKDSGILTIEELGISGSGLKTLEANLSKSHGMVLVTGPTGSGKSTTLYAMIQKVYNEGVNIITLEDPIEYQMKGINQSQVNSDIGYTFAAGLRSILRQDPDIIMLGEIRDRETAEMAVHAALTGHVVLSTLHTNDAAGAAPRMIDMGVEPFLLTSSINVVIGQRLVRVICSECKEETKLAQEELDAINKEIDRMPDAERTQTKKQPLKFYKGKGCKNCDSSGYKGRIGIYEVLAITPEMQQLILKRVSSDELNQLAISQGMVTMIQDGILKALEGVTTMEEIWRATKN